jgi:hypothetical protein
MVLPSRSRCPVQCERVTIGKGETGKYLTDIDAISANDNMTRVIPAKDQTYVQKRPARPPLISPCVFALPHKCQSKSNSCIIDHCLHYKDLPSGLQNGCEAQCREWTEVSLREGGNGTLAEIPPSVWCRSRLL